MHIWTINRYKYIRYDSLHKIIRSKRSDVLRVNLSAPDRTTQYTHYTKSNCISLTLIAPFLFSRSLFGVCVGVWCCECVYQMWINRKHLQMFDCSVLITAISNQFAIYLHKKFLLVTVEAQFLSCSLSWSMIIYSTSMESHLHLPHNCTLLTRRICRCWTQKMKIFAYFWTNSNLTSCSLPSFLY